ncbi:MAG: hypothetical protein WD027_00275 [Gaiellales bacterium]
MRVEPPLIDRVRALLDWSSKDPRGPKVEELEHTLTDGYAAALALEGECLRIGRQMDEFWGSRAESTQLRGRLREREEELSRLRDLLAVLRRRTETARALAAGN